MSNPYQQLQDALNNPAFQGMFRPELYSPFDPYQYPWMCINYFIALYGISCCIGCYLKKKSTIFESLNQDKQRIVITYFLEIPVTTFALVLQIRSGRNVLAGNVDAITHEQLQWISLAMLALSSLYAWEMIYRLSFGWPLLAHHVCTVLLIQLAVATFYDNPHVDYLRIFLLASFYATTEQLSFFALILYRLEMLKQAKYAFFVAAAQSFLVKTAIFATIVYFYSTSSFVQYQDSQWDIFWTWMSIPLFVLLFISQLHGSFVLYCLGHRSSSKSAEAPTPEIGHHSSSMSTEATAATSSALTYHGSQHVPPFTTFYGSQQVLPFHFIAVPRMLLFRSLQRCSEQDR